MTEETTWLPEVTRDDVSRRCFLKWSAVVGGTAAVAGAGWKLGLVPIGNEDAAQASELTGSNSATKTVWSSCNVNCGSRCPLRLVVSNGQVVRVEQDNTGDDILGSQRIPACLRGRSIRQRIYNADRLKYPMKRVGAVARASSPVSRGTKPSTRSLTRSRRPSRNTATRPSTSSTPAVPREETSLEVASPTD